MLQFLAFQHELITIKSRFDVVVCELLLAILVCLGNIINLMWLVSCEWNNSSSSSDERKAEKCVRLRF